MLEKCLAFGARAAGRGIEVKGIAKHGCDRWVFFHARYIFDNEAYSMWVGLIEVSNYLGG